jgi:hypothetical protein
MGASPLENPARRPAAALLKETHAKFAIPRVMTFSILRKFAAERKQPASEKIANLQ